VRPKKNSRCDLELIANSAGFLFWPYGPSENIDKVRGTFGRKLSLSETFLRICRR
jgi:hypothetical protein